MDEKEYLAKAKLVETTEAFAWGDKIFTNWEDLIDQAYCDEYDTFPEEVFCAKSYIFDRVYAEYVIDRILDNLPLDLDGYDFKFNGQEELQQALDAFREKNKHISWYEIDYRHKINEKRRNSPCFSYGDIRRQVVLNLKTDSS